MKTIAKFTLIFSSLFFALQSCKKEDAYVPPALSTNSATDLTTTSATVGIGVSTLGTGTAVEYGLVYGTTDNPTTSSGTKVSLGSTLTAATTTTAALTNLTPGTTYYARSFLRNEKETYYGNSVSFATAALKPGTVQTGAPSTIVNSGFSIAGNVTDLGTGGVTNYGHCISETNQTPTLSDTKSSLGSLTAPKAFTSGFGGLKAGTTYYARAYVTNNGGTAYGEVVQVKTTNLVAANVTTSTATGILSSAAKISGVVNTPGSSSITAYGHVWSETVQSPTLADSKTALTTSGSFPLNFQSDLTNLKSNTTYYARAYATSAAGTAYSTAVSFKTSDANDEFKSFNDLTITLVRGDAYSGPNQPGLLQLTTGTFFKLSEGPAKAANVDLIFMLGANSAKSNFSTFDHVLMYPPSLALDYDKFWGDFPTKLAAQNWSIYKATKFSNLNQTSYPPATWWAKINTVKDLTTILGGFNLTPNRQTAMQANGTVYDNRIYVFQTKEGKYGILRITDGVKKVDSYVVKFDLKVQK